MHINTQTLIGTLREALNGVRREQGMSLHATADGVVVAHVAIGADKVTGIDFNPPSKDEVDRMRANSDRVWRWLDDITKDNNLLPANMVPSLLASLPMPYRIAALNQICAPLGVSVRVMSADESTPNTSKLKEMMRECAEATAAYTDLLDGATEAEVHKAMGELAEAAAAIKSAHAQVECLLNKGTL